MSSFDRLNLKANRLATQALKQGDDEKDNRLAADAIARQDDRAAFIRRVEDLVKFGCPWAVAMAASIRNHPGSGFTRRMWGTLKRWERVLAIRKRNGQLLDPWPGGSYEHYDPIEGTNAKVAEYRGKTAPWMNDPTLLPKKPPTRRATGG